MSSGYTEEDKFTIRLRRGFRIRERTVPHIPEDQGSGYAKREFRLRRDERAVNARTREAVERQGDTGSVQENSRYVQ